MLSFSGEFTVPRTPQEVYEFLVDPHRLVKCLPDLMRYEVQDQDHFNVTVRVGVGRVRGPMRMKVEIAERREGSYARILGKGSMINSQISIDGSFNLSETASGSTLVSWTGNAKLGAFLMQLVGGLLDQLVQDNLQRFVRALEVEMIQEAASG